MRIIIIQILTITITIIVVVVIIIIIIIIVIIIGIGFLCGLRAIGLSEKRLRVVGRFWVSAVRDSRLRALGFRV